MKIKRINLDFTQDRVIGIAYTDADLPLSGFELRACNNGDHPPHLKATEEANMTGFVNGLIDASPSNEPILDALGNAADSIQDLALAIMGVSQKKATSPLEAMLAAIRDAGLEVEVVPIDGLPIPGTKKPADEDPKGS